MNDKSLFKSKRFWAGVISLLTLVSMMLTGEKTGQEQMGLIIASAFALIQTVIGILSGDNLTVGGKSIGRSQ